MTAKGTFTGRVRRRKSHPWVRFGDALARGLITAGGIGTIVAVLLVGVFLFVVAAPLFRPARSSSPTTASTGKGPPLAIGSDESGSVAWLLDSSGVHVIDTASGTSLIEKPAGEIGLEECTAIRIVPGGLQAAAGFADGSFRTGRLGLASAYLDARDVPADKRPTGDGKVTRLDDGVVVPGQGGQFSKVSLVTEMATPGGEALPSRVIDIDVTPLGAGSLVAAIDDEGNVRVESATSKLNMLTGRRTVTAAGATIPPTDGFRPTFVRVSELGDQLFLFAADGAGRRYAIRDVKSPVAMESFSAGGTVTGVIRLFGGTGLAVARGDGTIAIMFAARPGPTSGPQGDAVVTNDGLRMVTARVFPSAASGSPVTAMACSPRSRLFAVSDAAGGLRLLQSTAGSEVLDIGPTASSNETGMAATAVAIADRENRLLAAGAGHVATWSIDTGYPEVSFRTLLLPVWYESYPAPVQAWETTGHEAFESKFGLMPLIFGTIKATLYSMLFATPIALLAAIYTSQFMHPSWRARVKPTIEMMASLPSVVLGFVAGLVFAPVIEEMLMPVLAAFFVVPATVVLAAHLWQLIPDSARGHLTRWRFAAVTFIALPTGVAAAWAVAPLAERLLFGGDVRAWLDGRGRGFGGWVIATLPLTAVATVWLVGVFVNPWLRRAAGGWSRGRASVVSLGVYAGGAVVAVALAMAVASFFDAIGLETRGGMFGTYIQRNALIVAVGMSFAIIPLVFTIADDALSSVPEHLRSASLGAGATPWQTAIRVIVPAAASGLFSAVMIGLGRAVGETMVVLMAAGNTPLVSWSLFNGFQTLSAAIATELPEAARGSTHYRVLFLAALVLFGMTFIVNTIAELVRQRFRKRAHEL
jgi:phosphate transport system permease protein